MLLRCSYLAWKNSSACCTTNVISQLQCRSPTHAAGLVSLCTKWKVQKTQTPLTSFAHQLRTFHSSPIRHRKNGLQKYTRKAKRWIFDVQVQLDKLVESVSPSAKKIMDNLVAGFRLEWLNIQSYWKISKRKYNHPRSYISYREEMTIYNLNRDGIKAAPLLPIAMLPMGFFLILIPVYLFPRLVLPQTFWSKHQRYEFLSRIHRSRTLDYGVIVHHLNYHKLNSDTNTKYALEGICNALAGGNIPSNSDMLNNLKPLCRQHDGPFNVDHMVYVLLRAFCRTIMVSQYQPPSWLKYRLRKNASLVISLDHKLRREGLLNNLSSLELSTASMMRGIDGVELTKEAQLYWLNNWLQLTKTCDDGDVWFVLHAMVLMSYNYSELKYQRRVFG
ncbi:LETM1 domain-containing protein 1-like [Ciona intestinalis]